ncbi:MAG: hypothetical protein FWH27_13180 [Planctomycetaceae bacterium]|nr:hypothetical protein [Planctomycetaceae bacterium]
MGIDFLDIMYRLEKELGIRFEREDFHFTPGGKYRVGDFYDLVERKVCKASREILDLPDYWDKTFNEVRQVFADGLGLPESDRWTKETAIHELYLQIPETERRKTWNNFKRNYSCWWSKYGIIPTLVRQIGPHNGFLWMAQFGYVILALVLACLLKQLSLRAGSIAAAVLLFPGSFLCFILLNRYYDYRRDKIMPGMTLGEITNEVILRRKQSLTKDGLPYTREEIEEIVKVALCEALAVKPEDVTPEADLVRDLGME